MRALMRSVKRTRCAIATLALVVPVLASPQALALPDRIVEALRAGRAGEAADLADEWIQASPADPRPWTLKGLALAGLGRSEDGLHAYKSALSRDPDYLPALQGAAEIELLRGRPEARGHLERIVQLQPGNTTAHAMLGVLAYAARDCDLALEHFARGSAAVSGDAVALRQRAECFFATGLFVSAAEDFRRLLVGGGESHGLRYNLGLALHEAGRAEEAVEVLLAAVAANAAPDIDTLSLLADAQHAAEDPPGALATLRRAIRSYPRSERLYLQLAELCIEHGAYDLGIEIVEIGSKNIPDSFRVLTMRGILLAELGRYDEAEAAFQVAADADVQSAAVGLSLTLQKTGRLDESLEVLRARVEEAPDDVIARFFFAQALIKQGVEPGSVEFQEARDGLLLAAERLPREAAPRIELGKLYLTAKQPALAIDILEQAVGLAPDDRQATYNLMIALRRVGRSEDAAAQAVRMREQLKRSKDEEIRRNRLRIVKTADGH